MDYLGLLYNLKLHGLQSWLTVKQETGGGKFYLNSSIKLLQKMYYSSGTPLKA